MAERLNPSDNPGLFSLDRAKRGAKIGALTGIGLATSLMVLTTVLAGISKPELLTEGFKEFLIVGGVLEIGTVITLGATGALIDSFKPTSRLAERRIKEGLEVLEFVKGRATKAWEFIHQPDFMDQISQRKGEVATKVLLVGGLGVVSIFGFKALRDIYKPTMTNLFDEAFNRPSILPTYISEHPIELAIGIGVLLTYAGVNTFLKDRSNKRLGQKKEQQNDSNP